jgi:DNA-binding response OmpR family regulator
MTSKKTILVVDDDSNCSMFLNKVLSHYGYDTLIANTGQEAIAIFDKDVCHGVFLDISLPDIDGVEIAQHMRSRKENPFPIIAITGHSSKMLKSQKPNVFDYVNDICEKPFNIQGILKILQKYFDEE